MYDPHQGIWYFCLLFILSLKVLSEVLGRNEMRGILASHILLSQKPDPRRCKSYTFIKMCKCVEYFPIPNIFGTPLIMIFSLLINCLGSMSYISLFFFSILWNLHVFLFFLLFSSYFESFMCLSFFSIAPYFLFDV